MSRRTFLIVALTADLTMALAARLESEWSLPELEDDGRSELSDQVRALLARHGATGELLHETATVSDLARMGDGPYRGCCVAIIKDAARTLVPVAELLESRRPASGPQREALIDALERQARPVQPFDSQTQVADALEWARDAIQHGTGATVTAIHRHRCARHEYVIRLQTAAGQMFCFKGGRERVEEEARLTQRLQEQWPKQFPATLASDWHGHRWVYAELEGALMSDPQQLTVDRAFAVVRTLAQMQKQARHMPAIETLLASRSMDAREMFSRADRIVGDAIHAAETAATPISVRATEAAAPGGPLSRWRAAREEMQQICAGLNLLHLPRTLVHSDFWLRNIVIRPDGGGIGFIDWEQAYWSYPFLSLGRFLNDVPQARSELAVAFADEWAEVDTALPEAMKFGLSYLPFLGRLFGLLLESREVDLVRRGLDSELPAGYRAARLARPVEAVLAALPSALP